HGLPPCWPAVPRSTLAATRGPWTRTVILSRPTTAAPASAASSTARLISARSKYKYPVRLRLQLQVLHRRQRRHLSVRHPRQHPYQLRFRRLVWMIVGLQPAL